MKKIIILDSSALLASIFCETGADIVDEHLSGALISAINLAEVSSILVRKGMASEEVCVLLGNIGLNIVDFDSEQAFLVANLVPKTCSFGLSLGDRACLALGILRDALVLTGDRAWLNLDVGIKIKLIR